MPEKTSEDRWAEFTRRTAARLPDLIRFVFWLLRGYKSDFSCGEVVNATLQVAWRKYADFEGDKRQFKTWLFNIARFEALNFRRSETEKQHQLEDPFIELDKKLHKSVPAVYGSEVARALAALPEKEREAFLVNYVNRFSTAQTAELLGIPQGSVEPCCARAREEMRAFLTNRDHEPNLQRPFYPRGPFCITVVTTSGTVIHACGIYSEAEVIAMHAMRKLPRVRISGWEALLKSCLR